MHATIVLAAAMCIHADPQQAASMSDVAGAFNSLYAVYDTARMIDGYRAEHTSIPRATSPAELSRAIFNSDTGTRFLVDGWGTPLHIESDPATGYVIVAAGSDRKFDRATWSERAATSTTADDIVFRDGALIRSPVGWITAYVANVQGLTDSRDRLLEASRYTRTVASLRGLASSIATYEAIEGKKIAARDMAGLRGALEPKYAPSVPAADGWGHPFAVATDSANGDYMIVSAGPDGTFDKESWNNPTRATDDIVLHADGSIRNAEPPPQKVDAASSDRDRLLEAYAGYLAAVQRFNQSHR